MPQRSPYPIRLSAAERAHLTAVAATYTAPYCEVVRAKIVLYAAEGLPNHAIAARLDLPRQIVSKWRKRFYAHRLPGLDDAERAGRPLAFSPPGRGRRQSPRL